MEWKLLKKGMTPEHLGYLPAFLSEDDPRPAKEQIDANYQHGGGWHKFDGFEYDREGDFLLFPASEDGPAEFYDAVAETHLRNEKITLHEPGSWLKIEQPDGSWEVARVD